MQIIRNLWYLKDETELQAVLEDETELQAVLEDETKLQAVLESSEIVERLMPMVVVNDQD